jgi:hypothetical protein
MAQRNPVRGGVWPLRFRLLMIPLQNTDSLQILPHTTPSRAGHKPYRDHGVNDSKRQSQVFPDRLSQSTAGLASRLGGLRR